MEGETLQYDGSGGRDITVRRKWRARHYSTTEVEGETLQYDGSVDVTMTCGAVCYATEMSGLVSDVVVTMMRVSVAGVTVTRVS